MTISERVAKLETKVDVLCGSIKGLDDKVDSILQNHLPHIREDLAKMKVQIIIGASIISIIGSALVNHFLR